MRTGEENGKKEMWEKKDEEEEEEKEEEEEEEEENERGGRGEEGEDGRRERRYGAHIGGRMEEEVVRGGGRGRGGGGRGVWCGKKEQIATVPVSQSGTRRVRTKAPVDKQQVRT